MNETLVVIVRGLIGFLSLLVFTRLLGKQQISQLTFFDYIIGITIGSTASSLTTDLTSRAWPQWVGIITWITAAVVFQYVTLKWRFAAKYVDGEPTVVIMNGQIMEKVMGRIRLRLSDLLEHLRDKGIFDLKEVEFAILETNGKLSVCRKSQYQAVTPSDLNLPTQYKGVGTDLIYDGVIFDQNLRQVKLDRRWLYRQLSSRGISDPNQVFIANLNTSGELYIDSINDSVKYTTDMSDYPGPN